MTIYEKQFYETVIKELPKLSIELKTIAGELKKLNKSTKLLAKSKNKKND